VVDVLGPPVQFQGGSDIVALKHMVTPATLGRVRAETGIQHPVLTCREEAAPPMPMTGTLAG
jgi:hypothetical protein